MATTHSRRGMIHYTESGVRLTERGRRQGRLNWLFLPDGPGIGSESLAPLVDLLHLPGTSWLVDLPGDGSNLEGPGIADDPFRGWPRVLVEAAATVPAPVFVGHAAGATQLLAVPQLEQLLVGLALVGADVDMPRTWWPTRIPVLILGDEAGHPPWTGDPTALRQAFDDLRQKLDRAVPQFET